MTSSISPIKWIRSASPSNDWWCDTSSDIRCHVYGFNGEFYWNIYVVRPKLNLSNGNALLSDHTEISVENAKTMVGRAYILLITKLLLGYNTNGIKNY